MQAGELSGEVQAQPVAGNGFPDCAAVEPLKDVFPRRIRDGTARCCRS